MTAGMNYRLVIRASFVEQTAAGIRDSMGGTRNRWAGSAFVGLSVLTVAMPLAMTAMAESPAPPRVTSYSQDYCNSLTRRLDAMMFTAHVPPSSKVIVLSEEGRRMCDAGHTRGGIARLRRALMLLQEVVDSR